MRQDERIYPAPKLIIPEGFLENKESKEQSVSPMLAETVVVYVKPDRYTEYPGYIERPIKLVSKKIRQILLKYQKDIVLKPAVLVDKENGRHEGYYLIDAPIIECAARTSKRDAYGNITEFHLDAEKTAHMRIFMDKEYKGRLIVRLDVAESILRRKAYGIRYEKVNVIFAE